MSQYPVNQILIKFENLEISNNIVHLKLSFYVPNWNQKYKSNQWLEDHFTIKLGHFDQLLRFF